MTMAAESVPRTLAVVIAVALFCSAMVSGAVYLLRPIQAAYALLERNRTIVEVAYGAGERTDADVVLAFLALDARVLDLESGEYVPAMDSYGFDHWSQERVEQGATRRVPIYFVTRKDARAYLVLPVEGPGMWSTLQGYVGLREDLQHIATLGIFRHGETPGIGDRIQNPDWLRAWHDKQIVDAAGAVLISGVKSEGAITAYQIDLLTGATITSSAVVRLVSNWFGEAGYGPWLARLRADEPARGVK
jgi:Na+-transporting NADH:ubiquinone oxidoreductase subunit C